MGASSNFDSEHEFTGDNAARLIVGTTEDATKNSDVNQALKKLRSAYQLALEYYKSTWEHCVGDLGLPEWPSCLKISPTPQPDGVYRGAEGVKIIEKRWASRPVLSPEAIQSTSMQLYEPWSANGLNGAELEWWLTDGKTDFDAQTFGRAELRRWIEATDTKSAYHFDRADTESASRGEVSTFSATGAAGGLRTGVDSGGSGPPPLTTGDIAHSFAGLHWKTEEEWKTVLGKGRRWVERCAVSSGTRGRGGAPKLWNPVYLGSALVKRNHVQIRSVRAKFQTVPVLKPWLEAWEAHAAANFDTE